MLDECKKGATVEGPRDPSRRHALRYCAMAATAMLAGSAKALAHPQPGQRRDSDTSSDRKVNRLDKDVRLVHSVCLGCNARCGNRVVVRDGRLVDVTGNPYHPYNTMGRPVDYATPVLKSIPLSASVCGKAKDVPNYVYNPYRILRPLKRAGKRGSGRFEPIEWDQLINEITFGGQTFRHLGEKRRVPGLLDLDSDAPMDPSAPELGPARNGFIFMTGRLQPGRKAFIDRFVKGAMGSINRIGHTDICGLGFRMGNYAFTEGRQVELKADPWKADYILVFGANIYAALQPGVNTYGAIVSKRHSQGRLHFTIVDPRAQEAVVHADRWIPIRPGQDGAFAMGMIRWIIEHEAYNLDYLAAPNQGAARALGNNAYSNATHLVITDPTHPGRGRFLRMRDMDPGAKGEQAEAFIVLSRKGHQPVSFQHVEAAMLDVATEVACSQYGRIKVKTAFRLMKEGVMEHSLDEYARLAGVDRSTIEDTARQFTSYGQRAAVCQYHGAGNYVGGTYAAYAIACLNALVGNVERKGGYMSSGGAVSKWKEGAYDLLDFPGRRRPKGVRISREKAWYEASSEYKKKRAGGSTGYPAKRPWFSFTKGGLSVETLAGIDEGYPYPCKILFTYFFNPLYSIPGGYRFKETLADTRKVPLHVSIDIGVNESNLYADYIVPDVTYAEGQYGWLPPHAPAFRFTGIRTPCIEPLTGRTGDGRPFCLETFLIDIARASGLPGFGKGVIHGHDGHTHDLIRAEDFYLRGFANIALNANIPRASRQEQAFVEKNYPVARFKRMLPVRIWKRICYMLARGGIFKDYEEVFEGSRFRYGVHKVALYNERLAATKDPFDGSLLPGTLKLIPPNGPRNGSDNQDEDYPFYLVTHKMNVHTQSRTVWHKWAMEIFPENFVVMNEEDAAKLGIGNGDMVRLISRGNPEGINGRAKIGRLVRKGCIAVSFHYGHTQLGASRLKISGGDRVFLGGKQVFEGDYLLPDPALAAGLNPNQVSDLDVAMMHTPMIDPVGGIPDFSTTRVKILKVDQ